MNVRAIKADAGYVLRNHFRSRVNVVTSIVMPIVLFLAFGLIFHPGASSALPVVAVADEDGSSESARLVAALSEAGLTVRDARAEQPDGAAWLRAEEALGAVRIPAGFGAAAASGGGNVSLVVNDADPDAALRVRSAVESAVARVNRAPDAPPAIKVERVALEAPPSYASFLLPGFIGLNAMSVGLFTSFHSVTQLRTQGLLGRLAVAPISKVDWILGRMVGQSAISLLVTAGLVLAAALVLDVPFRPSVWNVALAILGTLVFAGLGTMLGGLVKQVETGGTVINLVYFPMVLLSGVFFDPDLLPTWLQWFPKISPLSYLIEGLRADMIAHDAVAAMAYTGALALAALLVVGLGARLIDWTD